MVASKTPAKATPAPKAEAAGEDAGTAEKAKRTRRNPVRMFEVVDDLPDELKRRGGNGGPGAPSVFVEILRNVVDQVPPGKWVKVSQYPTQGGARNAKKDLEEKVAAKSPVIPAGHKWSFESRKVEAEGEGTERQSALFVKYE